MFHALEDLGDDSVGILAARVVARHVDFFRKVLRHPAHLGTLAPVAVAARAEDHQQLFFLERVEHLRHPVGGMRKIDDDERRFADDFHAAADAGETAHRVADALKVPAGHKMDGRNGRRKVVEVEKAVHGAVERMDLLEMLQHGADALVERIGHHLVGRRVLDAVRVGLLEIEIRFGFVLVDQLFAFVGKETVLDTGVLLERSVVVEVVLGDIRQDFEGESDPLDPILHDGVGAHFHDEVVASRRHGLVDMTIGRKQGRRRQALALDDLVVHEEAARPLQRRLVSQVQQHGVDGARRRRFPVGPGHSDDLDALQPEQGGDFRGADDGVRTARFGIVEVPAVQPRQDERRLPVALRGVFRHIPERPIRQRYLQPGALSGYRAAANAAVRRWGTWPKPFRCSSSPFCGIRDG